MNRRLQSGRAQFRIHLPLCASHSHRLRRLGSDSAASQHAEHFAALSASLTCAYWEYFGSECTTSQAWFSTSLYVAWFKEKVTQF